MRLKKIIISLGILAALIGLVFWGLKNHIAHCALCSLQGFSPEAVRHFIQGFGPWAIFVYIILYILNTITLVPPIAVMSLSAGALFGPVWGTVALAAGAFAGTTATFLITRYTGARLVQRFVKGRGARFNEKLGDNGFFVLLPMRLTGFPPYEFVNYASGLSKISYKDYIAATMIGMAPAIILQVLLADRLVNFSWKDPVLYVAAALFAGMIIVTGKIVKEKQKKDAGLLSPDT